MALFSESELQTWLDDSTITTAQYNLAYEVAVGYLEGEVGVKLASQSDTITYTPRWDEQWVDLPVPTTSVTSVTVDGTALSSSDWTRVDNRIFRSAGWGGAASKEKRFAYRTSDDEYVPVVVELTHGFADGSAPAEFKTWGLILASQALKLADKVGVQSERIDDYSVTFATGAAQAQGTVGIPAAALGMLRGRYGRGAWSVRTG